MTDAAVLQAMPEGNTPSSSEPIRFSFSGTGGEYFRIWIVNLLFSILTLGIYSAWAKVRRTNYFYNSSSVAGSSFEYHGNPIAILKGRIIAVLLIVIYNLAFEMSDIIGLLMILLVMLVAPWPIWRSLQFKLYNSSYRGIRFGFRGELKRVYMVYLLLPLLTLFSFFILAPFTHQRIKKFQHTESRFGTSHFSFSGTVGRFYKAYLVVFTIWLTGVILISLTLGSSLFAIITADGMDREAAADAGMIGTLIFMFALYVWLSLIHI